MKCRDYDIEGIRTLASEETGALNQHHRPLSHTIIIGIVP
jgi:hypothetical protein